MDDQKKTDIQAAIEPPPSKEQLMIEIAFMSKAQDLLGIGMFMGRSVFNDSIASAYTREEIASSKLLQFATVGTLVWFQHVQQLKERARSGNKTRTAEQWKQLIYDGIAPFNIGPVDPDNALQVLIGCYIKQFVNDRLYYGCVDSSTVAAISKFIAGQSCLEVGSGNGMIARLLACEGINITATDAFDIKYQCHGGSTTGIFYPVVKATVEEAVVKFPSECLLLVWPKEYEFPKEFKGNKVIYIGEPSWGCTDAQPPVDDWELVDLVPVPRFPFAKDQCYMYLRK